MSPFDIAANQPITHEFRQVDGLVMTDVKQFYTDWINFKPKFIDRMDLGVWTSDCTCSACKQGKGTTRRTRDDWSTFELMSDQSKLDPADYLLCPREIPAFVFRTRAWGESTDSYLLSSSCGLILISTDLPDRDFACQELPASTIRPKHD